MRIGDPLRNGAAHPGYYTDVRADRAAAQDQLPVPKRIFDSLQHAAKLTNLRFGNTGPLDTQIDELRNGEEPEGRRNQADAVPQVESSKSESFDARDRV